MRKKSLLALIATVIVLTAGCSAKQSPESARNVMEGFELYENSTYNIETQYPSDWNLQEDIYGTVVSFLSPLADETDLFQDNLNVSIQDLGDEEISIDDFTNLSVEEIKKAYTDIVLEQNKTMLDGNDAYEVSYTFEQSSFKLKALQVYAIKNQTVYIITFVAETDSYTQFEENVRKMIDSFVINP
ncbi:MAG: PsbP-related protein [Candidatus Peregrinibacteria bacterium]